MLFSPHLRLFVKAIDIGLQLLAVDPPHSSAPDLDRGELARSNERVDLRNADAQVGRDVFESQESGLDVGPRLFRGWLAWHGPRIAGDDDGYMDLTLFAPV